ncbi:MAG: Rpn family recombination-promoting nuclease/putative transposase [Deferribacteraceae bacterium]|nr:Rpn family recombination-promoting nuclease/putative transposase [Deferribacteraceae bacterium]
MRSDEMKLPKILPPTDDLVFKTILMHPDTRDSLKDIITSFTGITVKEVALVNTELPKGDVFEKMERLDVNCATDSGDQVNVEMQTAAVEGDSALNEHKGLKTRFIYNLCDLHSSQRGKGIDYKDMVRSYQLTFCGFPVFAGRDAPFNWFKLRSEDGFLLSEDINIGFVDLTKLGEILRKPVRAMNGAEGWSVFIKYADNPNYEGLIESITAARREIKMANEVLVHISQDEHERAKFRSRRKFLADWDHSMIVSRKEGKAEGKAEVALEMLQKGMDISLISELTNLSISEIETLKTKL